MYSFQLERGGIEHRLALNLSFDSEEDATYWAHRYALGYSRHFSGVWTYTVIKK
jgi:hypothetical protein